MLYLPADAQPFYEHLLLLIAMLINKYILSIIVASKNFNIFNMCFFYIVLSCSKLSKMEIN